ncbi:MAG TPA: DinB family protein [Gemmatimonadales bacterium]|nr:DinB family protein [Gemmatimonadales bacterium]
MGADRRIALLVDVLDQAFDHRAWHGTPLAGALRGVTWREALQRPRPGRHNIWELALHTAYWKYVVRRRLTRDPALEFPRNPANWPAVPAHPTAALWRRDVLLLKREHRLLRDVVARFPAGRLQVKGWHSRRWTNIEHIYGIASHDLYHAGQIQLIKALRR